MLQDQKLLKRRKRLCGKQSYDELNNLLEVFAIAALVQLSVKYYNLPETHGDVPRMVCNMNAFETRSLTKLVHEEYVCSSKPLVEHICAQCGCLLAPHASAHTTSLDRGQPGKPFQTRGCAPCAWGAMPPFLLLFSKATLARKIPNVFELHTTHSTPRNKAVTQLRLRSDVTHLPWLNYRRGAVKREVNMTEREWHALRVNHRRSQPKETTNEGDESKKRQAEGQGKDKSKTKRTSDDAAKDEEEGNAWWYCRVCWKYWHNSSKTEELRRIPMRNWLEGHYTRWHCDVAYVHLYPTLMKQYPKLSKRLPTPADVKEWKLRVNEKKRRRDHSTNEMRIGCPCRKKNESTSNGKGKN